MGIKDKIRQKAMETAAKALSKKPVNGANLSNNLLPQNQRTLTIFANDPAVADKIQSALQELVNRSNPKDIEDFAHAVTTNSTYMDLAVAWLPSIK
jgi:hypothetical protein